MKAITFFLLAFSLLFLVDKLWAQKHDEEEENLMKETEEEEWSEKEPEKAVEPMILMPEDPVHESAVPPKDDKPATTAMPEPSNTEPQVKLSGEPGEAKDVASASPEQLQEAVHELDESYASLFSQLSKLSAEEKAKLKEDIGLDKVEDLNHVTMERLLACEPDKLGQVFETVQVALERETPEDREKILEKVQLAVPDLNGVNAETIEAVLDREKGISESKANEALTSNASAPHLEHPPTNQAPPRETKHEQLDVLKDETKKLLENFTPASPGRVGTRSGNGERKIFVRPARGHTASNVVFLWTTVLLVFMV